MNPAQRSGPMAGYETAFIVVSKAWFDSPSVSRILHGGSPSASAGETHTIIAPIRGTNDLQGVWLKNITTTQPRTDGKEVKMDFMIPWSVILALGVVPESEKTTVAGFRSDSSTSVLGG
jgi:hypothetical protein